MKDSEHEEYNLAPISFNHTDRYFNFDVLIEVTLSSPADFKRIVETLTRIGKVEENNTLKQLCYILSKQGRYFLMHLNEMKKLNGDTVVITDKDLGERNLIAGLLTEWKLLDVKDKEKTKIPIASLGDVRVIKHQNKSKWNLISEINIGRKRVPKTNGVL